jgi:hypothetical protein
VAAWLGRPAAVVSVAPLVVLWPFVVGWRSLYWGTPLLQFYPWRDLALRAARAGTLPLWNPYLGHGAPLLANYQTAVFYPPNWLALVVPLDLASGWLAALHLAGAGLGMVALARALGLRPLGQAMAGLVFGISQYQVARVGFFSINAAVTWLPWLIWAVERQISFASAPARPRITAAFWLALFVALALLAGHAQTCWYALLLAGAWSVWRLSGARRVPPLARLLTAAWLAMPVLLGALLAAIQLLPTAELLRESPRATSAEYEFVMTYSFSPWRLLTLLAPDLLGNPARGTYYGYGNYWEDAVYVGVVPLLLALGTAFRALAAALRRRRMAAEPPRGVAPAGMGALGADGLPLFLAILAAVTLVLALGRNTPIFPWLYRSVPTFNLFQAPTRMMIWMIFALALLAGMGADLWQAPTGRALYWTRLGTMGAASVALVGLLSSVATSPGTALGAQLSTVARALALAGAWLLSAALLALLKARLSGQTWSALAIVLVAGDLIVAGYGLNPGADPAAYRQPAATSAALEQALAGHRLLYFPADEYSVKFGQFLSFRTFGPPELALSQRAAQLPNVAMLDGLASANNFDPLVSARYAGLMDVISATRSINLLRMIDVAVVASPVPLAGWERVLEAPGGVVGFYRVPAEVSRVWVVGSARTAPDAAAALAAVADPGFDPAAAVILEAGDAGGLPNGRFLTPSPNAITISVALDQSGWVVLADTYYPGWDVSVDGQPARLHRANYALRAVAVPAGAHEVVFDYRPRSLATGAWITAVAGVVLSVMGGLAAWPRRVPPSGAGEPGGP